MEALAILLTPIVFVGCGRVGFDQVSRDGGGMDADGLDAPMDAARHADGADATRPDAECETVELVVEDNLDDGEVGLTDTEAVYLPHGEAFGINIGHVGSGPRTFTWGYFRFRLPEGLSSGRLVEARLSLWGWETVLTDWDPAVLPVHVLLEDADDAPVVTDGEEHPEGASARPVLPTSVRWPATGGLDWQVDAWNVSPDLSGLLNDVAGTRGDLAPGAHVQLWLRGDPDTGTNQVGTVDFSWEVPEVARLSIRMCD